MKSLANTTEYKMLINNIAEENDINKTEAKEMLDEELAYLKSLGGKISSVAVDNSCNELGIDNVFSVDLCVCLLHM